MAHRQRARRDRIVDLVELKYSRDLQMQDIQPIIIPTLSKTKISSKLSYPVGAEQISVALASAPQLAEIKLHFYLSRFHGNLVNKGRRYHEFLRVEYTNDSAPAQEWPIIDPYGCPLQGGWEIIVQPVPRAMRSRVN
jgi:hypothetical protein